MTAFTTRNVVLRCWTCQTSCFPIYCCCEFAVTFWNCRDLLVNSPESTTYRILEFRVLMERRLSLHWDVFSLCRAQDKSLIQYMGMHSEISCPSMGFLQIILIYLLVCTVGVWDLECVGNRVQLLSHECTCEAGICRCPIAFQYLLLFTFRPKVSVGILEVWQPGEVRWWRRRGDFSGAIISWLILSP